MSKKKSLGHNPLAYSTRRHASFDFITPSENRDGDGDDQGVAQNDQKVNKITASYYLEEPLVNKVRSLADKNETSYSALVNKILKNTLKNISAD